MKQIFSNLTAKAPRSRSAGGRLAALLLASIFTLSLLAGCSAPARNPEASASSAALLSSQTLQGRTEQMTVTVAAPAGALPKGCSMQVKDVTDKDTLRALSQAVQDAPKGVYAVDITFQAADGSETEPQLPVQITLASDLLTGDTQPVVVRMDRAGKASVTEQADPADLETAPAAGEVVFESDSFPTFALVVPAA